jgi:hypothetical protein
VEASDFAKSDGVLPAVDAEVAIRASLIEGTASIVASGATSNEDCRESVSTISHHTSRVMYF